MNKGLDEEESLMNCQINLDNLIDLNLCDESYKGTKLNL